MDIRYLRYRYRSLHRLLRSCCLRLHGRSYRYIRQPISGIGILGIIISSLVVFAIASANDLFATEAGVKFATAMALFMTSVVVCIAAISNDNLQDLKTGQLVGATPWKQQVALLIGSVAGAIAIAPVLNLLYEAYGFTGALPRAEMDPSAALSAPQATLMTTIAQGIFSSNLDWDYILIGVGIGIIGIIVNLVLKSTTATYPYRHWLSGWVSIYRLPSKCRSLSVLNELFRWQILSKTC